MQRLDGKINRAGALTLDTADVANLIAQGTLTSTLTHEIGHILGVGSNWVGDKLEAKQGNSIVYLGKNGIVGQQEIGGTGDPIVSF